MGVKEGKVVDKIVEERIAVLKAAPDFRKLKRLCPAALRGKELGVDISVITTDVEFTKEDKRIVLSNQDWNKWTEFNSLCDKLADRYKLHWGAVQDLAMGVKKPKVHPRLSETITACLDPICYLPKDGKKGVKYVGHTMSSTPLEAVEIMKRVEGLDEQTRDEVREYLKLLARDRPGGRILELEEAHDCGQVSDDTVKISINMRIPVGFTAREVAEVYRAADAKRREVLSLLGASTPKRRRTSATLKQAEKLRLFTKGVNIYGIVDEVYGQSDLSRDQSLRKRIIRRRYRGRKRLSRLLPEA